jgi:hypothetical protein
VVICDIGVDFNDFSVAGYCFLIPAKILEGISKVIVVTCVFVVDSYNLSVAGHCFIIPAKPVE